MAQMEEASLLRQVNCAPVNSYSAVPASTENSNGHVTTTELHLRLTDVQKLRQELGSLSCLFLRDGFFVMAVNESNICGLSPVW